MHSPTLPYVSTHAGKSHFQWYISGGEGDSGYKLTKPTNLWSVGEIARKECVHEW